MKKTLLTILSASIILCGFSSCGNSGNDNSSSITETTSESETITTSLNESPSSEEVEESATTTQSTAEHRSGDEYIGVSEKDIKDLSSNFYDSVRNDNTGTWKCLVVASDIKITDYALSAYNNYSDSTTLLIIENLTTKESAAISDLGMGFIDVTIHKYIDGEEHDANIMLSGETVNEYWVYTDNGDVQIIL